MSLGGATIASNKTCSGIALINSDTIGLLFKPEDKTSLFEFLNYLLINREAINELGQAGVLYYANSRELSICYQTISTAF